MRANRNYWCWVDITPTKTYAVCWRRWRHYEIKSIAFTLLVPKIAATPPNFSYWRKNWVLPPVADGPPG